MEAFTICEITLAVEGGLAVVSAVAVERAAAAGRRRRRGVRVGRAVVGETVVAVGRAASVRVVARSDAHAPVMMEVLARLVQRKTLHPQIELLMTPRAVRRCENQNGESVGHRTSGTWEGERLMDPIRAQQDAKGHKPAADGSVLHTLPFVFSLHYCAPAKIVCI